MSLIYSFKEFESQVGQEFLQQGYTVQQCENQEGLLKFREKIAEWLCEKVNLPFPQNLETSWFDQVHKHVEQRQINEPRMHCYTRLNSESWALPTYFSFARKVIEEVLGNELVMQNRINVNVMMPGDAGSNIPLHIDIHSGESPFQCVLWIPMTDAHDTKGVFLLPPDANRNALGHFRDWMKMGGRERVMQEVQKDLVWPEVPFGSILLFSPTLLHGSVVNETNETRWSFNTRFKSLFSPYGSQEKGLGSFYLPIRTAPATHFGLHYQAPVGFEES